MLSQPNLPLQYFLKQNLETEITLHMDKRKSWELKHFGHSKKIASYKRRRDRFKKQLQFDLTERKMSDFSLFNLFVLKMMI